ncbi:electron transfer flavoprotein-ubiquinone oxidoreductase [Novosphingobium terrae]|uniref:electron transfer flavoprotein-ubiquinone oxidoreductase n=1 Tax=Novosphingobium terrae TaxID=2726189 RepID=UPI00198048B5|nr:electron transfer flavoprotein-ubiquinone oxidoreductase [Novosphingobium terrae]
MSDREWMAYDVVVVGGGPAGLSAAIRLKQLARDAGSEITICLLEKGAEIGAHILSGAVIDPRALEELFPQWREMDCPLAQGPVTDNRHWWLTARSKFAIPHALTPRWMHNEGTYTGSLGNLCRWLAAQAEELGVEIFPGFAAAEVLYHPDGSVKGVATGDMGIGRDGQRRPDYQPGMELHARYTLFAEGARGHLTRQVKQRYALEADCEPQVYGLGMKELWEIDPAKHRPGLVLHTQGWPLSDAYGGGFLYHQADHQVALGFVVGLGYRNPHLSPFDEFQRWKQHPEIRSFLEGGRRISYGARAINEGGWQAIPRLAFPGGALIGCAAGFVNVPRIKGTHTAMKSGMLAAESAFEALQDPQADSTLARYETRLRSSWIAQELQLVRNAEPLLARFGAVLGTLAAGIDMWMRTLGIGLPFTMRHHPDHAQLARKDAFPKIAYPKPDGVISFDRLSSVFLSSTNHEEDQPVHLKLADASVPIARNLPLFDEPAQRYCPAGVYEVLGQEEGLPRFQINAQNCLHCKTCDIKDPAQNITWVTPEGGGGPNYPNM